MVSTVYRRCGTILIASIVNLSKKKSIELGSSKIFYASVDASKYDDEAVGIIMSLTKPTLPVLLCVKTDKKKMTSVYLSLIMHELLLQWLFATMFR